MRTCLKSVTAWLHAVFGVTAIVFSCALFNAKPAIGQQITLRLHTNVPPVSDPYRHLVWWAKKIEKESVGRLEIQLFGSMQLGGKAPDVYDQVKKGVVDLGWTLPGYKAGLFPITSVFELPFIGGPARMTSPAVNAFLALYGKKEWRNVHPIVFHSAGMSVIHTRTKKLERLADFRGIRIRTPSRVASMTLAALGAIPVPIPSLRVTEALMLDVVDGAVLPWSISRAIRTIDVTKFHVEANLYQPIMALLMNKRSYDMLPADLKEVIDNNSGEWLAKEFGKRWDRDEMRGRAKAMALGHAVISIPELEQNRWRKVTQSIHSEWIESMARKGLPGREMVDYAVQLVAKYRGELKARQDRTTKER